MLLLDSPLHFEILFKLWVFRRHAIITLNQKKAYFLAMNSHNMVVILQLANL